MADWGLYSALRGTDDWKTKRDDQKMNLLAAERSEKKEQLKVAESNKAESDIAKYMEELQNLKVLPEDQERVSQAERSARQNVVAGIAKSNGDLKRYMSTGGITALNEYKTAVMGSEEVKQAGVNKVNLQNYLTQESKGNQRHKFVDVEVPQYDEQGNQIGTKVQKMSWQDQYNKYKSGEIKKLNYNGSETRIDIGLNDFKNQYKNAQNPYQQDNVVTQSNIYEKAISKGVSEEYAREQADMYADMAEKGGDTWKWNSKDPNELALQMAKLQQAQAKADAKAKAAAGRKLGATAITNVVGEIQELKAGGQMEVPSELVEALEVQMGFKKDKEGNYRPDHRTMVYDQLKPGDNKFTYDLSQASSMVPLDVVALEGPKNKKGEAITNRYLRYEVTFDDPTPWYGALSFGGDYKDLPLDDSGGITLVKDKSIEKNWSDDGGGNFTGTVLMKIDDKINSPSVKMAMNKYTNINENAQYTLGGTTDEDMQELSPETLQFYVDANPDMSVEEIMSILMSINQEEE